MKDNFGTHQWLGGMLSAGGSRNVDANIQYKMHPYASATYAFCSNTEFKNPDGMWVAIADVQKFLGKNISLSKFEGPVHAKCCFIQKHSQFWMHINILYNGIRFFGMKKYAAF